MEATRRMPDRAQRWLPDAVVVAVTVVLLWPLLTRSGYPVARDLVFTPRLPWRPDVVGVGSGSPRAAPLDAVIAALTTVVDGGLLAKLLVALPLLLAGWGAHRMVATSGLPARLTVAVLAVWNPFVVERLGLGQWAVLFGYAAVIHIVRLTVARRDDIANTATSHPPPHPGRLAPWLGLGALTPTGAILAGAAAVTLWRGRGRWAVIALAASIQLPWVLPGLLSRASLTSDPTAVAAFAARSERVGGPLWSLLGLGGIWDSFSVPGSRTGWLGHLTSILILVLLITAWRSRRVPRRLWAFGTAAFLAAALSATPPGRMLVEWAIETLPGAGLLRDSQKWLAPFVVLVLACAAQAVDGLIRVTRKRAPTMVLTAAVVAPLAPLLVLPDGAVVVHQIVRPVHYPSDYAEVADLVDGSDGVLVTLPWQLYRAYGWAGPYAAYDPSSRWFDTLVVTTDALTLGDRTIRGEDRYAERLREPAEQGNLAGLHELGVRWVVLHNHDIDGGESRNTPDDIAYAGQWLTLVDLGQPAAVPPDVVTGWSGRPTVVLVVDLVVLAALPLTTLRSAQTSRAQSATLR